MKYLEGKTAFETNKLMTISQPLRQNILLDGILYQISNTSGFQRIM